MSKLKSQRPALLAFLLALINQLLLTAKHFTHYAILLNQAVI